jgi:hypothetical protein
MSSPCSTASLRTPGRRKEMRRISISFDDIDSAKALNVVEQLLD